MTLKQDIFDFLEREHIGFIHFLLLCHSNTPTPAIFELSPEFYQAMPELKRLGELALRDIAKIMQAPSQKDFRKGRLPSEKKPLSKEKQLAAFLLATKDKRESLRATACLWNYLLFTTQESLPKKKIKSLLVDFLLARRSKLLRKWRVEPRFKELMRKFERDYMGSFLNQIVSTVLHGSARPLPDIAREMNLVRNVVGSLEKSAFRSFKEQFAERLETTLKKDRAAGEALALAVLLAFEPLSEKQSKQWFNQAVDESFLVQGNAVKALVTERNKKKRVAVAASIEALMRMRQIVLMNRLGMFDHAAHWKEVIEKFKEKMAKSMREKAKKKK